MNIAQARRNDSLPLARTVSPPPPDARLRAIALFLLSGCHSFCSFLNLSHFSFCLYSLFNWNGMGPATHFIGFNNSRRS